jgi:hypothetical protein
MPEFFYERHHRESEQRKAGDQESGYRDPGSDSLQDRGLCNYSGQEKGNAGNEANSNAGLARRCKKLRRFRGLIRLLAGDASCVADSTVRGLLPGQVQGQGQANDYWIQESF